MMGATVDVLGGEEQRRFLERPVHVHVAGPPTVRRHGENLLELDVSARGLPRRDLELTRRRDHSGPFSTE
jgi:uncharacterized protein (DUF2384 family)